MQQMLIGIAAAAVLSRDDSPATNIEDAVVIRSPVQENTDLMFVRAIGPGSNAPVLDDRGLVRRFNYTTFTGLGRSIFCYDENWASFSYGETALVTDCLAIGAAYPWPTLGCWTTLTRRLAAGRPSSARETCAFRINFETPPAELVYFGAQDLTYFINTYSRYPVDGRITAWDSTRCNSNRSYTVLGINWRLEHV
ncbi:hypothetical protein B0T25DRAFT_571638 [Lasiosphaeria hispida]|uniref:Ecp2 effector protein-like domain-containing protein n=1 Tax=Lasiosphaeria hispida TaxID=260671 RepID=A0AAJ0MB52_9PEZI|nr:hypothetical protein B0T25DRAFT_571638 [Lasiosphaeria hispida]